MIKPNIKQTNGSGDFAVDKKLEAVGRTILRLARRYGKVTSLLTRGQLSHESYCKAKESIKQGCYDIWIHLGQLICQRRWFDLRTKKLQK